MRTERQHQIDRAVIRSLREVRRRLVPALALRDSVAYKIDFLSPTAAEIDESIRYHDGAGHILGLSGEVGRKFQLTEAGEAWAMEHEL